MASVTLEHLGKSYGGKKARVRAVDDLNLSVADKEFVVLVGPSGCGKTTTLRLIAGLEKVDGGSIRIGDRVVNEVAPKDRDVAMVFQNYALYPHMTVFKNMAFGLKMRGVARDQIRKKVQDAARMLSVEHLLDRKPGALSGGERQRVAVGRAIVRSPHVFLFDEPLSNLDAKLRVRLRTELKDLHRNLQTTMIYVTHDQEEAMTLGDRIAIMRDGVLQQCSAPLEAYNQPVNRFVAGFIGTPSMNFIEGHLEECNSTMVLVAGVGRLPLARSLADRIPPGADRQVVLGIRPEHVHLPGREALAVPGGNPPGESNGFVGIEGALVRVVEPLGDCVNVHLTAATQQLIARVPPSTTVLPDDTIDVFLDMSQAHLFAADQTGQRLN